MTFLASTSTHTIWENFPGQHTTLCRGRLVRLPNEKTFLTCLKAMLRAVTQWRRRGYSLKRVSLPRPKIFIWSSALKGFWRKVLSHDGGLDYKTFFNRTLHLSASQILDKGESGRQHTLFKCYCVNYCCKLFNSKLPRGRYYKAIYGCNIGVCVIS